MEELSSYLVLNAINNKMVKSEFPDLFEYSDNKDYEPEYTRAAFGTGISV